MNLIPIKQNMTELKLVKYNKYLRVLFSYSTPVAYHDGFEYYRTDKRWSNTTSRHISQWLNGLPAKRIPQHELDNLLREVN